MTAKPLRVADVVDAGLARADLTTTTPSDRVVVAVDGDVVADDGSPITASELEALGRELRGWHGGSCRVVYAYASQLPRSVVVDAIAAVRDSESARSPVAVLVSILRDSVAGQHLATEHARGARAVEQFGYDEPSAIDRLRSDPERWVRALASTVPQTDVDAYLVSNVENDLERQRLRRLAEEIRAT